MASHENTPKSVLNAPHQTITPVDVDRMPFLNRRADKQARRVAVKIRRRQAVEDRAKRQAANTVVSRARAARGDLDGLPGVGPMLGENVRRDIARRAEANTSTRITGFRR